MLQKIPGKGRARSRLIPLPTENPSLQTGNSVWNPITWRLHEVFYRFGQHQRNQRGPQPGHVRRGDDQPQPRSQGEEAFQRRGEGDPGSGPRPREPRGGEPGCKGHGGRGEEARRAGRQCRHQGPPHNGRAQGDEDPLRRGHRCERDAHLLADPGPDGGEGRGGLREPFRGQAR